MKKEKDSKWLERLRDELKIYMKNNHKNQNEIGEMLGVTRTSVNRLLNGQTGPDLHRLDIYVNLFNIDMNYVFTGIRKEVNFSAEKMTEETKMDKMYVMIERIYQKEFMMHPAINVAESPVDYETLSIAKVNNKVNKDDYIV
jgi:transcriptional regulator with XRE-family HTH domain